jgi:Phosphoglycerate dehydrogenase and related dehydrogenases
MFKINYLNPISSVAADILTDNYVKVDNFSEANAALVRSASVHELELPKSLEAIARAGAGVNNIPLDKCTKNGIVVFNTPGANANGVKELVIAGLLLASRDIVGGINWVDSVKEDPEVAKLVEKRNLSLRE